EERRLDGWLLEPAGGHPLALMIGPTAAEHNAHQIDDRTTARAGVASAARRLLSVAALLEILCFLTITFVDADLWGHLTFGRDIVRQGWVHTSDPYSFTS